MNWDNSTYHENAPAAPSNPCICDDPKIATQHFPTGFIGNPHATPLCEIVEFSFGRCPPASQVGTVEPIAGFGFAPIYNLQPHPQEPSLTGVLGAAGPGARLHQPCGPDRERLRARREQLADLPPDSRIPVLGVELWGVPDCGKPHQTERFIPPLTGFGLCMSTPELCAGNGDTGAPANVPPMPYLENPTTCGVPLTATM